MHITKLSFLTVLLFSLSYSAKSELQVITNSKVIAESGTGEAINFSDNNSISRSVKGEELSLVECGRKEGRNSIANVSASSNIVHVDDLKAIVQLTAHTSTKGGHYRTCGYCTGKGSKGLCVNISPVDTSSEAKSYAEANLLYTLNESVPGQDQILIISALNPDIFKTESFKVNVTGGDKYILSDENDPFIKMLISPLPEYHNVIQVNIKLTSSSSNEGGCCETITDVSGTFTASLQEAAIMESLFVKYEPRLVEGKPETGFEAVGLIELLNKDIPNDWRPHCSGTLIKPKVILTAAHCLNDYLSNPERLRFMIGNIHKSSEAIYRKANKVIVPTGEAGFKHEYRENGDEHIDDIGLIFLERALENIEPMTMVTDPGLIQQIETENKKLTFIGFGGTWRTGSDKGLGKKHRLDLTISDLTMRRFKNNLDGFKTTCRGDSGGPAFIQLPDNSFVIAGLVSKGDRLCRVKGVNTRVDFYENWVSSKL